MKERRKIALKGRLDAEAMAGQRDLFEDLAKAKSDLVLDMAEVEHLDSAGLGGIAYLYKRLKADGFDISLENTKGQPLSLIEALSLTGQLMRGEMASKAANEQPAQRVLFTEQAA